MRNLKITSARREEIIDITTPVGDLVAASGFSDGALLLFCQHTTCGLTINESADPAVKRDLITFFRAIAPHSSSWEHQEGNTDAHIRSSLLGFSLLIPVAAGRLALGTWQAIYLYEGDGPRTRNVLCQFLREIN